MSSKKVLIKFDPTLLLECITSVCSIHISANTVCSTDCLLIEQIEFNKTRFTTSTPNRNYVQWFYNHEEYSGGMEGQSYLVLINEFVDKVRRLKDANVDFIILKQLKNSIQLAGEVIDTNGISKVVHRLTVRQYAGSCEDYPKGIAENSSYENLGTVPAELFKYTMSSTCTFGGFSTRENNLNYEIVDGTGLFAVKNNCFYALIENTKRCRSISQQLTVPCAQEKEYVFGLDGIHLHCLKRFSSAGSVLIGLYEDASLETCWVRFSSANAVVDLRVVNTGLTARFGSGCYEREIKQLDLNFKRKCSVDQFHAAVKMQRPNSLSSELLLTESEGSLQIQSPDDLQANEASWVALSPDATGDFSDILVSQPALELACKSLKSLYTRASEEEPALELIFGLYSRKSVKLKRTAYSLGMYGSYLDPNIDQVFFCLVKSAQENVDQLDIKE